MQYPCRYLITFINPSEVTNVILTLLIKSYICNVYNVYICNSNNLTKMKDRIAKLLKSEGMTAAKLADEIGVQASGISHILSGRNNPSTDFIVKLLERFRGINAEWLLMGKGSMYKTTAAVEIQPENPLSKASHSDLFTAPVQQEVKYPENKPVENPVLIQENTTPSVDEKLVFETKTTQTTFHPEHNQPERKVKKVVVLFNDGTFDYYDSFK